MMQHNTYTLQDPLIIYKTWVNAEAQYENNYDSLSIYAGNVLYCISYFFDSHIKSHNYQIEDYYIYSGEEAVFTVGTELLKSII